MKNTLETRVGIFFTLTILVAFAVFTMTGDFGRWFKRGEPLKAYVNDVGNLRKDAPVKLMGDTVGYVEKWRLDPERYDVELRLRITDKDALKIIRTDSRIEIRTDNLMGNKSFVVVTPGNTNAPMVSPETTLTSEKTFDMQLLLGKLEQVASSISALGTNLSSDFMGPLNEFFKDNKDRLTQSISNLQTITAQVAQGNGTVGRLIREDALYTNAVRAIKNLEDTTVEFDTAVRHAKSVLARVDEGQGTLGKLTQDSSIFQEVSVAANNLRDILQKVNRGQGSVGKLVNDDSLYKNIRISLQKLDKMMEGMEDQGPLSVLGIAASSLIP